MQEWRIFNDESADYSSQEAVESDFFSEQEALQALKEQYTEEDQCHVHKCEDTDKEDE